MFTSAPRDLAIQKWKRKNKLVLAVNKHDDKN